MSFRESGKVVEEYFGTGNIIAAIFEKIKHATICSLATRNYIPPMCKLCSLSENLKSFIPLWHRAQDLGVYHLN